MSFTPFMMQFSPFPLRPEAFIFQNVSPAAPPPLHLDHSILHNTYPWEIIYLEYPNKIYICYRRDSSGGAVLCGTEQEIWLSQMLVHLVCNRNLSVGKGLERLFVRLRHLRLYVIEEQGKWFTAHLCNLIQLPFQCRYLKKKKILPFQMIE